MQTFVQFVVLGLGVGTAYVLLSQGLVLIYRGTGVINFAHGAAAMVGAFVYWQFRVPWGMPAVVSIVASIAIVATIGVLVYHAVMRPLGRASALARVICTLGLLILLEGIALLVWGSSPKGIDSEFPTSLISIGGVSIGLDKLILFAIALALTAILWALSRFTAIGLALRGNAENPRANALLGWSPHLLGGLTWGVGWGLAAIAGILLAPLIGVSVDTMPLLVIPVLAAALLGRLSSFWGTFVGAMAIGIVQSVVPIYVTLPGITQAIPFVVILFVLVIRRRGVPVRSQGKQIFPSLGTGRVSWWWAIGTAAVLVVLIGWVFPDSLVQAVIITLSWGLILLSIVVLLGYTGQLSLAQAAIAGIAALFAGRFVADLGIPFLISAAMALVLTVGVGLLFSLPALRTRGIDLAIVTLGLGATVSALIFQNGGLTGGLEGTPVGPQEIFGISFDTFLYPRRWAVLITLVFVAVALLVAYVRRSILGRRMLAVRNNERAAASMGISVLRVKLYAFGLSALIAGVGGILLAFRNQQILYTDFDPLQSVLAVGYSYIGGVGFVLGAPIGATLIAGGFGSWVIDAIVPGADPAWLNTIAGGTVILLALSQPNGIVAANVALIGAVKKRLTRKREPGPAVAANESVIPQPKVAPMELTTEGLTVKFGGVTAVNNVSLGLKTGMVLGLIGPNGAGKTTFIDAVTGFVEPASGTIVLNDHDITRWSPHRRARAGLARSFQSLELFESSTVRENLSLQQSNGAVRVPRKRGNRSGPAISATAAAAVADLGLEPLLDEVVSGLSYGQRRLVAIARALASRASILMLDEPAAGLSSNESRELALTIRHLVREWGIGVLLVEHDMSFVMGLCDEIVVLDFGHRIAGGTPMEVRSDPEVIAAYLGDESTSKRDEPVTVGGAS